MGPHLDAVLKGNIALPLPHPSCFAPDTGRLFVQAAEMMFHAALAKFIIMTSQRNFLFPCNSSHSSPGSMFLLRSKLQSSARMTLRAVPALGAGCSPRRGISCCSTHGVPGSCLSPCPLCSLAAQPGVTRDGFANVSGVGPWRGKGLCYTLFLQKLGLNLPVCSPAQHSIPCVLCCRSCEP